VHIWLGVDRNQALAPAQLVLQLQQWLSVQGETLAALVYNGRTLWSKAGDGAAAEASMMPSAPSFAELVATSSAAPQLSARASLSGLSQRHHQEILCQ